MKTIIAVLFLSSVAFACQDGCEEHQGVCACNPEPFQDISLKPSEEKPSRNRQPAWERGEVVADMPNSLIASDQKLDREIEEAKIKGIGKSVR